MIFNRGNKGTEELRTLTGNYFANNDFSKVSGQIGLVTETIKALIGDDTYREIENLYVANSDSDIIGFVQRPIAILSTLRLYQRNDLSHEDDGRKMKIDPDNEKLPWEWQLQRDDQIHMEDYYQALDVLMKKLEKNSTGSVWGDAWHQSTAYKIAQSLLLNSGQYLSWYVGIENPYHTYYFLLPYLRSSQLKIKEAYGDNFGEILEEGRTMTEEKLAEASTKYDYACRALIHLAMMEAMNNTFVRATPFGIVRYAISDGGNPGNSATDDDIFKASQNFRMMAKMEIEQMKKARDSSTATFALLPENYDRKDKYLRL